MKSHYDSGDRRVTFPLLGISVPVAPCGADGRYSHVTSDKRVVTCKRCLKAMAEGKTEVAVEVEVK